MKRRTFFKAVASVFAGSVAVKAVASQSEQLVDGQIYDFGYKGPIIRYPSQIFRAKKGGEWVNGKFYKEGQFIPSREMALDICARVGKGQAIILPKSAAIKEIEFKKLKFS